MNLDQIKNKQFYKFTGPPENWVTAIKFMTWGLEEKYKEAWGRIQPGDIFLMHSTSTNTRVKGAASAVIGFGVVGNNPTIKHGPLWIEEIEKHINKWPLLVPFSEVYLFSPFFEYEYFEIQKFQTENNQSGKVYKNLAFSQRPKNGDYAQFMNSLDLGVSYFDHATIQCVGEPIGLEVI